MARNLLMQAGQPSGEIGGIAAVFSVPPHLRHNSGIIPLRPGEMAERLKAAVC